MNRIAITAFLVFLFSSSHAAQILIPMDDAQHDHLRAYGICYKVLNKGGTAQWLLNYRYGSFLFPYTKVKLLLGSVSNVVLMMDNNGVIPLPAAKPI